MTEGVSQSQTAKSGRCFQIRDEALEKAGNTVQDLANYLEDALDSFCPGLCLGCRVEEARHGVHVVLNSTGALVLGATQALEKLTGLAGSELGARTDQDS